MYYPSYDLFKKRAREGNLIPLYKEILVDKETPVSIFLKINNGKNTFLLENIEGDKEGRGRYSFLGASSKAIFRGKGTNGEILENGVVKKVKGNPVDLLEKLISNYKPVKIEGLPSFYSLQGSRWLHEM